jgi:two-component system, cell cycle sensor histidine kinase and response regulator CckA
VNPREGVDAENYFRQLYEQTPAMLHSIDGEGRLVGVSHAWLARLGYTREEVVGRRSTEFLTPESARYAREVVLPQYYETGECTDVPYQFVAKNGERVDVLLSATSERDENGMFVRSMAALIDVTEKNRLAERLDQAKRMETIGQLAGGVAHDLNNILLVIRTECMLAASTAPEETRRELEGALEAVTSGERLARQLLTIAGRQSANPEHVQVDKALDAIARHVRVLLPKGLTFEVERGAPGARIWIDPGQLEQALLNLLLNARDALTGPGKIVLSSHIKHDARAGADNTVVIGVADTGIGMGAETLRRATEPLFTTKPNGTGLGLATTRRIVEGSQGTLRLRSREGEGSLVEMSFALSDVAMDDAGRPSTAEPLRTGPHEPSASAPAEAL